MEIKANIDGRMTIQRADAIKAYLHALYATPDYIFNNSLSDFKLKNAPPSIQNNINDFIMGIRGVMAIPEPDGKPRPEWKVFYGKTWEEARNAAHQKAMDDEKVAGEYGRAQTEAQRAFSGAAGSNCNADFCAVVKMIGSGWAQRWDEPAIMYASMLLVEDRDFLNKEKHIAFAKSTWEICQKGYGWFVDVAAAATPRTSGPARR